MHHINSPRRQKATLNLLFGDRKLKLGIFCASLDCRAAISTIGVWQNPLSSRVRPSASGGHDASRDLRACCDVAFVSMTLRDFLAGCASVHQDRISSELDKRRVLRGMIPCKPLCVGTAVACQGLPK
jgi:hypothetical protein